MELLEKWKREDLINHIDEFDKLYENRPIKDNHGGMNSSHMLSCWFIIKKLKPKVLIESGVWKGLGTWFFEKARPITQIISIDPATHMRIYTSPAVTYQTEDFLQTDWSHLPKGDTLVFFDDHQNCIPRLKKCLELGFKRVIVEDNYPPSQGDCYSPKKVLSNQDYVIDSNGQRIFLQKDDNDLAFFKEHVEIYQEMPPIFSSSVTRWGDIWNEENYPTPLSLLPDNRKDRYETFYSEKLDYTWICYIELRKAI